MGLSILGTLLQVRAKDFNNRAPAESNVAFASHTGQAKRVAPLYLSCGEPENADKITF